MVAQNYSSQVYLGFSQGYVVEHICENSLVKDVWQDSKYASVICDKELGG